MLTRGTLYKKLKNTCPGKVITNLILIPFLYKIQTLLQCFFTYISRAIYSW